MKPVIAIPRTGSGLFQKYMMKKYTQSLQQAGAQVRWISPEDPESAAAEALKCDGLLLAGGPDVNPALYGQTPAEKCGKPDDLRDRAEMKILKEFLLTNKPVFCICRGMQLLNVYFGGTLHQDISRMQIAKHSHFPSRKKGIHKIRLLERSKILRIAGNDTLTVNSLHHQAIDKPGPGLTVSALSGDGFIEAVEIIYHPFCIGVQWHPEHMSKQDPIQQKFFDAFVEACRQ